MDESAKLVDLRAENARLIAILETHGIAWKKPVDPVRVQLPSKESEPSKLSTGEKVALFMRLFRGRTDVYPIRWESQKTGKVGYSPVCVNEWRAGFCDKLRVKCSNCSNQLLKPLTDVIVFEHLAGKHTIGVYPLLTDDTCHFLAADFDEADWREDVRAFAQSCREMGVPAALEISRSGNGAHVWIFFARSVPARDARQLGTAIISHTCARTRQLKLNSYDRLFPNQDTMPKGGFGNLIALPLQKKPRELGFSMFVDEQLVPYADQWGYLASIRPISREDMESVILLATGNTHPLDVAFIAEEDQKTPWKQRTLISKKLSGKMPKSLKVTLANMVYFEKAKLPQPLVNRLIRLAAFQNPEFYKLQAMRMPAWDEPRVIGCADNFPKHIALPRGCLSAAQDLLRE
ncbi:MAG: DNA primase small subunit domain-containing protein, partial [Gallionella sp.]